MLLLDDIENADGHEVDDLLNFKKLILHATPLCIGNIISVAATFGNAVIITKLGKDVVAANIYIGNVKNLLLYPTCSIFFALQPLLGKAFKENDYVAVSQYWKNSLLLGLEMSFLLSIPLLTIESILVKANQDEHLAKLTGHYFQFFIAAVPTVMINEVITELFITTDNHYLLIPTNLLKTGLELSLNIIFIDWLDMGIEGWAMSSVLQSLTSCCALLIYIANSKKFSQFRLFDTNSRGQMLRVIYETQKEILQLGVPICLQTLGGLISYSIEILMLGKMDINGMIANGVCNQWYSWIINAQISLSASTSVLTGQQIIERNPVDAKKIGKTALNVTVAISILSLVVMSLAYKPMINVLLSSNSGNESILSYAKIFMPLLGISTLGFGVKSVITGAIRGYEETSVPMYMDIGGTIAGLGLSAILGFATTAGPIGVGIGDAIGLMLTAALILTYFSKKIPGINRYSSMFRRVSSGSELVSIPNRDADHCIENTTEEKIEINLTHEVSLS